MLFCKRQKFRAVCRNKFLVGSHNAFARAKTLFREIVSDLRSTDGLANYFRFGVGQNIVEILCNQALIFVAGEIADVKDMLNRNVLSYFLRKNLVVLVDEFNNARTYDAVTHNCYSYHFFSLRFRFCLCQIYSLTQYIIKFLLLQVYYAYSGSVSPFLSFAQSRKYKTTLETAQTPITIRLGTQEKKNVLLPI